MFCEQRLRELEMGYSTLISLENRLEDLGNLLKDCTDSKAKEQLVKKIKAIEAKIDDGEYEENEC